FGRDELAEGTQAPFGAVAERLHLPLRDPFRIARDEPDRAAETVIVTLFDSDGREALGEAFPVRYYGETSDTVEAVLPLLVAAVGALGPLPQDLSGARGWLLRASGAMDDALGHHGGAKCAMDIALHDLVGQRLELPLHEVLGTAAEGSPTDFSIGLDEPSAVAGRAARAAHFPALKIKVGGARDLDTLEAVRAVFGGPIRVDANTGWTPDEALRLLPELIRLGVELIEQPFASHQLSQLAWLQERSTLPIVADESAVTERDLDRLVGVVAGINVKITKCGGVGPGLRMVRRARELGFKVMLGCMEETSVGIAAAAALASLAEWVDLDGNLLLADDPFDGLELSPDCRWLLPREPGLGLGRRPD
ncbi:MAG: dipeptide epimerase, partial [Chloroflexi bacterium]|nr:dipeptide epimerase [Chloroflexota bacterium]